MPGRGGARVGKGKEGSRGRKEKRREGRKGEGILAIPIIVCFLRRWRL